MTYFLSKKNLIYLLLFITSIIGFNIINDYGIGIEEHFQRKSGFYWLNFILNYTNLDFLSLRVSDKLNEINQFTPNLFPIEKVPYYGVIFDLPLAFIEVVFEINEPQIYFKIRHITIFVISIIGAYTFYKIIFERFNDYFIANFGFLIFVFLPRIFGNIFFDNKDILFLSILTFNFYFLLKYLKKSSIKNLIYFSLFCALCLSSRIIGILMPLSFIFFVFLKTLSDEKYNKNFKIIIIFIIFFTLFMFLHWPYLWTLSLSEWLKFFSPFFQAMNPTVYFNGEFYQSKYLPLSYLPIWIIITTPVFILILFIYGFFLTCKQFSNNFLNIESFNTPGKYDLWHTKNESFDLLILINFLLVVLLYISVDLALLSGWRHFYFLNFYMLYYVCFSLFFIFEKYSIDKFKKKIINLILVICLAIQIFDIYQYHPFQSSYFNNLISNKIKQKFEIDTQSLSRSHAIKEILKINSDKTLIGTASWTPLEDARSMINKDLWKKLVFVGTNFENADYIYSNHYYDVDINFNKKYQIPENFYLYKIFSVDGTRIYSIYKRK